MGFKLIAFDMDGVLFKDVKFWIELHKRFGTYEEGVILTKRLLHTDYDSLIREVVQRLWIGKDANAYYELIDSLEYINGAKETIRILHDNGIKTAIITASSIDAAKRIQKENHIDFVWGNELIVRDGKISGEYISRIGVGREKKAIALKEICNALLIDTKEAVFVGDSEGDIEAFGEVGLAIAFQPKSELLKEFCDVIIEHDDLREILKFIY
ncbi:MAG TPA: HAD family phosphatase [Candidatus Woesearchaeota archaeon]|nr:HAD family phosphatase [Candidatus Woesearchaeota archaeon]